MARLPAPSGAHKQALEKLFADVWERVTLDEEAIAHREQAVRELERAAQRNVDAYLRFVLHETANGCAATRARDVNVLICKTDGEKETELEAEKASEVLRVLQRLASETYGFRMRLAALDEQCSVLKVVVAVNAKSTQEDVTLAVSGDWQRAQRERQTATLIGRYAGLDQRAGQICVLLSELVRLCGVSSLSAEACSLLAIHFLQQTEPAILPVLHGDGEEEEVCGSSESELDEGTRSEGDECQTAPACKDWRSTSVASVPELLLACLRYYALEFDPVRFVVSVRRRLALERGPGRAPLFVQDPCAPRRNVAAPLHARVFAFLRAQMLAALRYFAVPQTRDGPLFARAKLTNCPPPTATPLEENLGWYELCERDAAEAAALSTTGYVFQPALTLFCEMSHLSFMCFLLFTLRFCTAYFAE